MHCYYHSEYHYHCFSWGDAGWEQAEKHRSTLPRGPSQALGLSTSRMSIFALLKPFRKPPSVFAFSITVSWANSNLKEETVSSQASLAG